MLKTFLLFALLASMASCSRVPFVTARSEYLRPNYLASEAVNTPDPCRDCFYGQQIVIHWRLPENKPGEIHLSLRLGNRETALLTREICDQSGFTVFRLLNQDYWCKGGIASYKVDLYQAGYLIDSWKQSVWVEIIELHDG